MKSIVFLLFFTLTFSGCSLIYSYSDNLPEQINQWNSLKRYKLALDTIDHISPDHKDYKILQKKKKSILKLANKYEKEGLKKTKKLADNGEWILAFKNLDGIANNISETKNIEVFREKLQIRRDKLVLQYEIQLLKFQASDIMEKVSLYEKMEKILPENEIFDINEFNNFRNKTCLKLVKLSEQLYDDSQYEKALSVINLAEKLKPDSYVQDMLDDIRSSIRIEDKLQSKSYISATKSLLKKLSQGYSHAILKETKETIRWFKRNKSVTKQHKELLRKLEKHFKTGSTQNFEAGRNLYSKGKIQEALRIWLELEKLNPDHPKLKSHIIRAEKIVKKLETLSNKPDSKSLTEVN